MRRAYSIDDEALAERAVDLLLLGGIEAEVRESETSYDVWVHDEKHLAKAKLEIERLIAAPGDAEFVGLEARAAKVRAERDAELAGQRARTIDVRTERHRRLMEVPMFTSALIVICIGVAVLSELGKQRFPYLDRLAFCGAESFLDDGGMSDILHGQVWRLITPMLIHYGFTHLLFNMFWLRDLGGQIEKEYGWDRLILLILGTGIPAHLAQYAWDYNPNFGGMSGVVYGLFGYIWAHSRNDPKAKVDVDDGTVKVMIIWLFVCMTGAFGPIANTAHLVGLIAGVAIGGGPHVLARWRRRL
jgi:GlpG protein